MGCDTYGKIKGYINHKDIFEFIKNNYDKDAKSEITRKIMCPLSKCNWDYNLNEHSDDNTNWYTISGLIFFYYNDEYRMLFYSYSNINSHENLDYYTEFNLEDMVKSETTHISLGYWGSSVQIIKEIIKNFGGGWLDENDCNDELYKIIC